jgi:hypothetical protein
MPPKFKIDIGPDGFEGPGNQPKFKVKKNHRVEFNLVKGAAPVNVVFGAGSPFTESSIPVGSSGSGELAFRDGIVGESFTMEVQAPTTTEQTSAQLMGGRIGDIQVEPYP